eukprot:jgi/Chlat1/1000/Chrsp108S01409
MSTTGRGAHVAHALRAIVQRRSSDIVTVCDGRSHTGAQFVRRIAAVASGIGPATGLKRGDRVAIAATNSDRYLELLLALAAAGLVAAPLNCRWGLAEAAAAVNRVEAAALACDEEFSSWWPLLRARCASLRICIDLSNGGDYEKVLAVDTAEELDEKLLEKAPDDIALVCFTSGTTGAPKGVALSHAALVMQSLAKLAAVSYSDCDVYLHAAPLYHIGGITSALAVVMAASSHVFLRKFSAAGLAAAAVEHGVTAFIAVPAMLTDLANHQGQYTDAERAALARISTLLAGGGPLDPRLEQALARIMPSARIVSAYGMSEACSSMTFRLHVDRSQDRAIPSASWLRANPMTDTRLMQTTITPGSCVGIPAPHTELRIASESNQHDQHPVVGEIVTRGPHVMSFYWGQPAETASAVDADGWLYTGDLGWMDQCGRFYVVGRTKDTVRSGGENVYASEVERVLVRHPLVVDAAVVGMPDARLGETVAALVVINSAHAGTLPTHDELQTYCRQHGLSRYKVPRVVVFQAEPLPVNSLGKVQKHLCRDVVMQRMQSQTYSDAREVFSKL